MIKRIVVTGPESVGKSTLCAQLASHYGTVFVPEFAREYVENLGRPYEYQDVEQIARTQIEQLSAEYPQAHDFVFFDTGLIITKVWFDVVYGMVPDFLTQALSEIKIDLYLLLHPDIEWKADGVRENSGSNRLKLYDLYEKELEKRGFSYKKISGFGQKRFENAILATESARCL